MNETVSVDISISTRLMQGAAAALTLLALLVGAAAAVWRFVHLPAFNFTSVHITGETMHSSESDLRSQVLPQLHGNFFTMRLEQARSAFQSQPWVQHVIVRRVFPGQLVVQLREHQEAAYWGNEENGFRLLSND